jgi:hypothetical protein
MAHATTVTGGVSELIATAALLNAGWQVSKPEVAEVYDRIGITPDGTYVKLQIKTVRLRNDRKNQPVVYGTKGDGTPYTNDDCDYLVGVHGTDVYLMKCRNIGEYWYPERPTPENEWVLVGGTKNNEVEAV